MSQRLPEQLVQEFMTRFYGYGSYSAPYWFVGMEEGGGSTLDEIETRINLWDQRGKHELEDVRAYHLALGIREFFVEPTKSQSTWRQLIRILLSAKGETPDLDDLKTYQREKFGQWNQESCFLELLPLPSPSTSQWLYSAWPIAGLESREAYRSALAPQRAAAIRDKIALHQPRCVVFYSVQYKSWWEMITGMAFTKHEHFFITQNQQTHFVLAPHPVSTGVKNSDYEAIGQWLNKQIKRM